MANIVNLTPHSVTIGGFRYAPSGQVARVSTSYEEVGWVVQPWGDDPGIPIYRTVYGAVEGLPAPVPLTVYLVSGMVAAAVPDRADVFAPATGHPGVIRVAGQVASVPGVVCTPAY